MYKLIIEWKHFDVSGKTCARCSATGVNLAKAINELQVELALKGVQVEFKETKLPENRMAESNEVLIGGVLLERLLPNAKAGENNCPSCADLMENFTECHCRTISKNKEVFEEIPNELIKQAILNYLSNKIMKIQVLGTGCPSCHKLFESVKEAAEQLQIGVEVEYIQDMQKIIELGIMSVPALAIDDKVVLAGQVPDVERLKEIISSKVQLTETKTEDCCSCSGKC